MRVLPMSKIFMSIVGISMIVLITATASAQDKRTLAIAAGNTGGVYYPLAGGLGQLLSKHVPGWQATAEVTGGSVDNLKLVGSGKSDIGFSMVDVAWDAYIGNDKFANKKLPLRTLVVLYPNRMHVVTTEASGITTMKDLASKRVSVGAPGSATEVMAMRVLEAYGLAGSIKRERLSVNESVNAIKDRNIDAFFWVGGVPTAAITDLAATPGVKIRLLDHGDAVEALNKKYGPMYSVSAIPKSIYSGMTKDAANANVWNILFANASMPDEVAYTIVKTLFDRKADMIAVHKEFATLNMEYQTKNASPVPFHPGAVKFFAEKGVKLD